MENNNKDAINGSGNVPQAEQESQFDLKSIFTMFLLNWQWFALSVFVCLCLAVVYLRYKSPVYQVAVKILIKDDTNGQPRGGSQMLANMQDLGFVSSSNGIDNEVEILNSHILAREVVKDLKLYTEYRLDGSLKDQLIYNTQMLNVDLDTASLRRMDEGSGSVRTLGVKMKVNAEGGKYRVEGKVLTTDDAEPEKPFQATFSSLPAKVKTYAGELTFTPNLHAIPADTRERTLLVSIVPPSAVAARYIGSMSVEPTSKMTTIALVTISDNIVERCEDFLRQLVVCYNEQANADKNEIAIKTEKFINERLEKINTELGTTEGDLESYKRQHNLTQLKLDATETLAQSSAYSQKLSEAETQRQLLDYLREYIDNPENKYQIIPSNIGLQDVASTALVSKFNQTVLERNRLLNSASEIAPQVVALTGTLDQLVESLRKALNQAHHSATITYNSIKEQYDLYKSKIANTPEQERILTQIGRQQEVKSGLYLMLLQKREENSISLAATADKGSLIDDPLYGGKVSPKSSMIMLAALVFGVGIPFLVLYLMQLLRFKIEGHDDVARLTQLPIVADVAVASESAKSSAGIVVKENQNNQIDEIFRSMRTNIQFMLSEGQKVIMFTSSMSGEGKTFNAANLAVSFALLGKRVILMGLDIRRPALDRLFGIADRSLGITPLLAKGNPTVADIDSQIQPSGVNANLDLMLAGPVPPNPTELLARENMANIVAHLKEKYDYIIMDTAPVGLVSDTLQIGRLADVSVVICRADYTPKSSFESINTLAAENKLPNMCVVLNGVDMSKKKYGYYYGYGRYGKYGHYGYSTYGSYANSHYGNSADNSIKR